MNDWCILVIMIISMRPHATREEIDQFANGSRSLVTGALHRGEERVVIGVVGVGDVTACLESLEATPGGEGVRTHALQIVSKEFVGPAIKVNGCEIGGDEFVGGPARWKRKADYGYRRGVARRAGARRRLQAYIAIRFSGHGIGGAETAPQGQGAHRPRHHHGDHGDRDVEMVAEHTDCMQVGARNMQNFALLKSLWLRRPVLLKRG